MCLPLVSGDHWLIISGVRGHQLTYLAVCIHHGDMSQRVHEEFPFCWPCLALCVIMKSHPLITDNRNQNIKFHFPTAAIENQGCEEFLNYYVNGLEMKCMVTAFIPLPLRIDLIITSPVTTFRHSPPSMIYTFQNSFNFLLSLNDHSSFLLR